MASTGQQPGGQTGKPYLQQKERIDLIKKHRWGKSNYREICKYPYRTDFSVNSTLTPNQGKLPNHLPRADWEPIKLCEMDPTKDEIFYKRILNLTLIEDPFCGMPSMHLVAEDENGNSTQLSIYNIDQDAENRDKFGYGQRLAIVNPYMRVAMDGSSGIRVDIPKSVFVLGKKTDMCRYCGNENAQHKCARCKTAQYCSRECQVADWKVLNHKIICAKYFFV